MGHNTTVCYCCLFSFGYLFKTSSIMLIGWGGRTRTYAMLGSKPSALPTWLRPKNIGAPGRIRTSGTRIRSPLLYPTELQVHIGAGEGNRTLATGLEGQGSTTELHPHKRCFFILLLLNWSRRRDSNSRLSPWQGDALPLSHFCKFGGRDWIRTSESSANGFTVRSLWPTREPFLNYYSFGAGERT